MSVTPEILAELNRLVDNAKAKRDEAEDLLKDAKLFANEHKLSFQWSEEYGARRQKYVAPGSDNWEYIEDNDWVYPEDETGGRWMHSSNC